MPRPLPAIALCSLACSVALAGLWAATWWRGWDVEWQRPSWDADARAGHGTVAAIVQWGGVFPEAGWRVERLAAYFDPASMADDFGPWTAGGFGVCVSSVDGGRMVAAWCPLWFPVLLTAVPPAWWAWRRRRRGARGFEVGMMIRDAQ